MLLESGKTSEEGVPVLSVGSVVGGTTADPRTWGDAVQVLMRHVIELRAGVASPLNVNVVFQIPGEVVGLDWEGVRTGRFDRASNLLMVQATVPPVPPDDPQALLAERMREAVTAAERWVARRTSWPELQGLQKIVAEL